MEYRLPFWKFYYTIETNKISTAEPFIAPARAAAGAHCGTNRRCADRRRAHGPGPRPQCRPAPGPAAEIRGRPAPGRGGAAVRALRRRSRHAGTRSEEHTSELQSLMRISYAVFCLKKKTLQK